jgi:hypothetical protein
MAVSGMPEGHFPVRQVAGLPVITSPAEIDIANVGELRAALLAAAKRGDASVVVDMSGTAFRDSTGLNAHRVSGRLSGYSPEVSHAVPFPVASRRTGVRFLGIPFAPGTWGLRYLRPTGQRLWASGAICERDRDRLARGDSPVNLPYPPPSPGK